MTEGPYKPEAAPETSGVDLFEALVLENKWDEATQATLQEICEAHEEDLYMLYLNYTESGIVDELPEHERKMYDWLADRFK